VNTISLRFLRIEEHRKQTPSGSFARSDCGALALAFP
jgi:hypothetical protein